MTGELLTEASGLGTLQSEHRLYRKHRPPTGVIRGVLIFISVGMALFFIIIGILTLLGGSGFHSDYFSIALGSFIAGAASGFWAFKTLRQSDLAILLFEHGLLYTYRGKTEKVRWDEVKAVFTDILRVQHGLGVVVTSYGYIFHREEGTKFSFKHSDNRVEELQQVSDTIQAQLIERLLPTALTTYKAGGTVEFGKLTVNQQGIGNGKEIVPWTEVDGFKTDDGIITINKKGKWLNWSTVSVSQTPNVRVFIALVNEILVGHVVGGR